MGVSYFLRNCRSARGDISGVGIRYVVVNRRPVCIQRDLVRSIYLFTLHTVADNVLHKFSAFVYDAYAAVC